MDEFQSVGSRLSLSAGSDYGSGFFSKVRSRSEVISTWIRNPWEKKSLFLYFKQENARKKKFRKLNDKKVFFY